MAQEVRRLAASILPGDGAPFTGLLELLLVAIVFVYSPREEEGAGRLLREPVRRFLCFMLHIVTLMTSRTCESIRLQVQLSPSLASRSTVVLLKNRA